VPEVFDTSDRLEEPSPLATMEAVTPIWAELMAELSPARVLLADRE
jgi:hypothetical protein